MERKNSYVIAPQTAKIVEELGGKLVFTGQNGHGDLFAQELIPHLINKKLYILEERGHFKFRFNFKK